MKRMIIACALLATACGDDGEKDVNAEALVCEELNVCNLLEPGVSAQDCSDQTALCTSALLSSEQQDWSINAQNCLQLSNCKNFQACISVLPACSPVDQGGGGTCDASCFTCSAGAMCPAEWVGDGYCDCECSNIDDSADCG